MKGCNYNCIVSSIVPENMIQPLNKIYKDSEWTIKVSDQQWFHVFNREHCLTLQELLDFRKDGFIEIYNGQIALLMCKFIEKFLQTIALNVVHGNLTFDNVWIINKSGFRPLNQEHNYEIVFVNYQGGPSDQLKMQEILLTLNEIVWPKEQKRILDSFVGNKDQLYDSLTKLTTDLSARVDKGTQKIINQGWFGSSEISIYNKFKQFADPNIFTALLPIHQNQSKFDLSFNWHYLDKCRKIIIQQLLFCNTNDEDAREFIMKNTQSEFKKNEKLRIDYKQDLINFIKNAHADTATQIKDFIQKSMSEFEQIFKFKCNQSIKEKQQEYIDQCQTSIYDNYFEFNSDQVKQIEILKSVRERVLFNTQKKIIEDHQKLFVEEVDQLIKVLV